MVNNPNNKLLIVEDNPGVRKQLKWALNDYDLLFAENRTEAIEQIGTHSPGVVTLDLGLPPDPTNASEGLAALEQILAINPQTKVIVVTGNDDRANALQAISLGAYDFYEKPIDVDVLNLIVTRSFRLFKLEAENKALSEKQQSPGLTGIVGASQQIQAACRMVEKVAPTLATTLVVGESGTGKELFARALHHLSPRRDKPFVALNCAAIPENLLESELFGYEKGAFTGATKQSKGKIEQAHGGSLFLDEIGDMPVSLQAKMLRFLQERYIDRLGGQAPIPVDVRIICATHQNLEQSIEAQRFRQDLYFRISEIDIEIPPLRDRHGDKVLLAQFFLEKFSKKNAKHFRGYTVSALKKIDHYAWPGNVRELENKVGRAVILAEGQTIDVADLGFFSDDAETTEESLSLTLRQAREAAELAVIQRVLTVHNYNVSQAAETLGVSRPQLYNLMKKLGINHG
ncbi:MAG: PEP-CTERM-box response regulator transcription factor [Gammaproteobacteria bacterium]|nr:PEP-CTERM-box response regulator transcription factor [Gammaproteobacteria bacterium]